jgi:hypothetical protein
VLFCLGLRKKKTLLIVQKAQKGKIILRIFLIRLKYAIYTCPQPILANETNKSLIYVLHVMFKKIITRYSPFKGPATASA